MPIFSTAPPAGVNVSDPLGSALPAVHVRARHRHHQRVPADPDRARHLRPGERQPRRPKRCSPAGNAEALGRAAELRHRRLVAVSAGVEDDLSYHELVTGFLQQLCTHDRQRRCTARPPQHFQAYLKTPPALTLLTFQGKARQSSSRSASGCRRSRTSGSCVARARGPSSRPARASPTASHSFAVPALRSRQLHGARWPPPTWPGTSRGHRALVRVIAQAQLVDSARS